MSRPRPALPLDQEAVAIRSRYQCGSYALTKNHEVRAGPRPKPASSGRAVRLPVQMTTARRAVSATVPPVAVQLPVPADQLGAEAFQPGGMAVAVPAGHPLVPAGEQRRGVHRPGDRLPRLRDPAGIGNRADWPEHRLARDTGPVGALTADQFQFHRRDAGPAARARPVTVYPTGPAPTTITSHTFSTGPLVRRAPNGPRRGTPSSGQPNRAGVVRGGETCQS